MTDPVASYEACPTRRARRTKAEVEVIRAALYDAAEREHPVTCRRLFYVLVGQGIIEKTEAEYQSTVIRLLSQMREAGELPFSWLADHTRYMRKPDSFESPGEALEATAALYRRALWSTQPDNLEIWCEKAGLVGILYPITARFDVPLMICGGQPSKTFLHASAEAIAEADKPTWIYYLGDFDPSGLKIRDRVQRDLERYAPDAEIHFEHAAVTQEQIKLWDLPLRPTKTEGPKDSRCDAGSVEVDAVATEELRTLVNNLIVQHIDPYEYDKVTEAEEAERETLQQMAEHGFPMGGQP